MIFHCQLHSQAISLKDFNRKVNDLPFEIIFNATWFII